MFNSNNLKRALKARFSRSEALATRKLILSLLESRGPMPRADIVFFCRQSSFTETQVKNALNNLYQARSISKRQVPRPKQGANAEPALIFWTAASTIDVNRCERNLRQRLDIIDGTNILGETGERYVRSLLFHVRKAEREHNKITGFGNRITSVKKLGSVKLAKKETIDVTVEYSLPTGSFTLYTEVKNQFYNATKREINKLLRQGVENCTERRPIMPVLIASYIDNDSREFLEFCGIPYHALDRQVFPASLKSQIVELYTPEIALERFQFIPERLFRSRADRNYTIDPRTLKDVSVISNPNWIRGARETWLDTYERLRVGA